MSTEWKIRVAWIAGLVATLWGLAIALVGQVKFGTPAYPSLQGPRLSQFLLHAGLWNLVDVCIIASCTVAIALKSRAGAVVLFGYYVFGVLSVAALAAMGFRTSSVGWVAHALWSIPLWLGVRGTFEHHRAYQLRSQQQAEPTSGSVPPVDAGDPLVSRVGDWLVLNGDRILWGLIGFLVLMVLLRKLHA